MISTVRDLRKNSAGSFFVRYSALPDAPHHVGDSCKIRVFGLNYYYDLIYFYDDSHNLYGAVCDNHICGENTWRSVQVYGEESILSNVIHMALEMYYFSKPVPVSEFEDRFMKGDRRDIWTEDHEGTPEKRSFFWNGVLHCPLQALTWIITVRKKITTVFLHFPPRW